MNKLKHPDMREELIQHLFALSDADYQYRAWVLGGTDEKTGTIHDEFDYAVHFLYDDSLLANDPGSTVGWILRDHAEVMKILKLVESIEAIFQKYGTKLSDAEYIGLPEWAAVLATAKDAADFIR